MVSASPESRLPYFRGKGQVEEIIKSMVIPYAVIRPPWIRRGRPAAENMVADDAGSETFTFEELLPLFASAVVVAVRLVHTPVSLGFALTLLVGLLLRDEVDGLMAGLLTSSKKPAGSTKLGDWLVENAD